jgi:uncharacterized membrane protein YgcG
MKGEWVAAERVEEVRAAARGWKRAGAVSEGTFEEILRRYPEPRTLPAPLWRVVTFLLVSAILLLFGGALIAGVAPAIRSAPFWLAFLGAAYVIVAERQARSRSLARRGGVEAASLWGIVALVVGLALFLEENLRVAEPSGPNLALAGAAGLLALGAWRWGNPAFAGFAAGAAFVLLARMPQGRILWIAAGAALSVLAERVLDRPSWAPSHRASAAVLAVCGIAAVYAAVNLWSLDRHVIESLRGRLGAWHDPPGVVRAAAILATAILPLAVLARGLVRRRALHLDAGLVLVALSLVTLRTYVHIADLWIVLAAAGAVLVLSALSVNRWLRRGSGGERHGFTADPLFGDAERLGVLELVPVVAAHSPPPRPPEQPGFSGGGGSFGGGGAGSSW